MIKKKVSELKGNEILGKPLMTLDYQIILPEGAQLRPDYLEKMIELGVTDAWVLEEDYAESSELEIMKDRSNTFVTIRDDSIFSEDSKNLLKL